MSIVMRTTLVLDACRKAVADETKLDTGSSQAFMPASTSVKPPVASTACQATDSASPPKPVFATSTPCPR